MFPLLLLSFFFNDTATTEIYTLSLHDALPISPSKPFFRAVPVRDRSITHFPAEQYDLAFDNEGEIQQADIDIFHLDANGIDFRESILGPLFRLAALRLAASRRNHIDMRAAV